MDLFSLLIGINDYPNKPLSQCINDVGKVENYLGSLQPYFSHIHLKKLLNNKAKKTNVIDAIMELLSEAGDHDTCFLYYSGHGAQENSGGIFSDEHRGLLDCLVCHSEEGEGSGFLLADKEIRYLLSNCKHSPHLVTLFDCCHSGDMVRALRDNNQDGTARRIAGAFPTRDYNEFIFSKKITKTDLQNSCLASLIPYKNHIHLAACLSSELSWEGKNGGVFTDYLLRLLAANNSRLSYQEIAKWSRAGLKDTSGRNQTPTITIQGEGDMSPLSSWLNLPQRDITAARTRIVYNKTHGWLLTRGSLMGVKKGMDITVRLDEKRSINSTIESEELEYSRIKLTPSQLPELDPAKEYEAVASTSWSKLKVYVNDLEGETDIRKKIEKLISAHPDIDLSSPGSADFFVNIFNQMVYFSLPHDEFRPLAEQIDLLNEVDDAISILKNQLSYVIKWNHFNSLNNPDNSFDKIPCKIELTVSDTNRSYDIANTECYLDPVIDNDADRRIYQKFSVKVTNISSEELFIGVLVLGSDFGISARPFDQKVVLLDQGQSKLFYDHTDNLGYIALDSYQQLYNWENEWFHYLFIISNDADFTTSLPDLIQPPLDHPLVTGATLRKGSPKSEGDARELHTVRKKWGIYKSTILLKNPSYNIISNDLESKWDIYSKDEKIAPFIGRLYFNPIHNGFIIQSESKPNGRNKTDVDKGLWDIKIDIANFLDDRRRFRIFKRARKKMPGKPVAVAEGDSWFLYPFLVKDTIDWVMRKFPVRSLAAAGDTMEDYVNSGQLLKEVDITKPKFVLISGGGNDIIGPKIVNILNKDNTEGDAPGNYLNNDYASVKRKLIDQYEYFFCELEKRSHIKLILVHGYDYVRSDHSSEIIKHGWVNKYMIACGIRKTEDRERLIRYLIDNFNSDLEILAQKHAKAVYINLRGLIKKEEWYDEIHPNDEGFEKAGNRFIKEMLRHA
jgi:hypothetical protein